MNQVFIFIFIKPRQLWQLATKSSTLNCLHDICYILNIIDKVGFKNKGYNVFYVVRAESFWQNVWDACFSSIRFVWKAGCVWLRAEYRSWHILVGLPSSSDTDVLSMYVLYEFYWSRFPFSSRSLVERAVCGWYF